MLRALIERYKQLPAPVRATGWFACCSFFQRGISMLTTPVFTRLLSKAEYGQFGGFNSWMSILTVFITLNLFAGVFMQGLVKFEAQRERFASAMQGLCTALVTAWLVVYLLFREFWNSLLSLTTVQMLAMLLMIWSSGMYGFWSIKQRIDYRYRGLVLVTALVSVANPLLGMFLVVHAEDKVTARVLGIALVEVLAYSWMFFSQLRKDHTFFSKSIWRYALRFNIPLIPHYLGTSVLSGADRIMIEDMVGAEAAGLYTLAYSVSQIMSIFNAALLQTIEPWLYKRIGAGEIRSIPKVAYPAFAGIGLVNLFMIAFAPEVIQIFAPPAYYDAIWVVPPVAMSVYFMFAYSFFAVFEFYYEKTAYITLATVAGAAANVGLNAVFIRLYGYYAAGYTTLFCYMCYAVFHYVFMCSLCRRQLEISRVYNLKILLSITAVFMGAGFVLLSVYRRPAVRYGLIAGMLVLLFARRKRVAAELRNLLHLKKEK